MVHIVIKRVGSTFAHLLALSAVVGCAEGDTSLAEVPTTSQQEAGSAAVAPSPELFANPTRDVHPQTWFHAMSSNMSKEGITKDLEAMSSVGLKGFTLFHVTQGVPVGDVKFLSEEHLGILDHLAAESERLDLDYGIHNTDGWSSSGGPWVTPEMSMKELVWTETSSSGGAIDLALEQPLAREGYFADIAVVAYPTLDAERADRRLDPVITSSSPGFDGDAIGGSLLPVEFRPTLGPIEGRARWDDHGWIQYDFGRIVDIKGLQMTFRGGRFAALDLSTSNDGVTFEDHGPLPIRRPGRRIRATDAAIDVRPARYYRVTANVPLGVRTMKFSQLPMVDGLLGRTSKARVETYDLPTIGAPPANAIVASEDVIVLTDHMDRTGQLTATLPIGEWTIMRFGMTSTGALNDPASDEGVGLEIDKFSADAASEHYDAFVGRVAARLPGAIDTIQIDSYEVGGQSWTEKFDRSFADENGYDLIPYLPLFAGRFIDSADTADRVLSDTRRLASRLVVDNYYTVIRDRAREDGIATIIEPYGFGPFNGVDAGGIADIPMGEFWYGRESPFWQYRGVIAAARSAAHTYGRDIVGTEGFTAAFSENWSFHPGAAKNLGDLMWAAGVNEFTFHRFAHQANTHVAPGMVMHRWGINFDRTQPWWDTSAKAWIRYIARGQYMLRQGVPVGDILYVLGDAAPQTCLEQGEMTQQLGASLAYDCLNTERLLAGMTYQDGKITLASGAVYDALVIPETAQFLEESAAALAALVDDGLPVFGRVPTEPLGLAPIEVVQAYKRHADRINGAASALSRLPDANLADLTIEGQPSTLTAHRRVDATDIYFISNPAKQAGPLTVRVDGACRVPTLWDPLDGSVTTLASFSCEADGGMRIRWDAEAEDGMFLVLTEPSEGGLGVSRAMIAGVSGEIFSEVPDTPLVLAEPWQVTLEGWQVPTQTITVPKLFDLKDHPSDDVRHHSGSASYRTSVTLPDDWAEDARRIELDLGHVAVAAVVTVNGQEVGTVFAEPYSLDVTGILQDGKNAIEVRVDNLWVNRLIGDEALPATDGFTHSTGWTPIGPMVDWYKDNQPPPPGPRSTFTTARFFEEDSPLVPSGLIGPVTLTPINAALPE